MLKLEVEGLTVMNKRETYRWGKGKDHLQASGWFNKIYDAKHLQQQQQQLNAVKRIKWSKTILDSVLTYSNWKFIMIFFLHSIPILLHDPFISTMFVVVVFEFWSLMSLHLCFVSINPLFMDLYCLWIRSSLSVDETVCCKSHWLPLSKIHWTNIYFSVDESNIIFINIIFYFVFYSQSNFYFFFSVHQIYEHCWHNFSLTLAGFWNT